MSELAALPSYPDEAASDHDVGVLPNEPPLVALPHSANRFRRFLAFAGPAFLISVGYMDPGNWATDIEGGSRFRYQLLWVILASNLIAIMLQTLSARLGLITRRDLAQMCRERFNRPTVIALWLLAEVAIGACDLAEVLGSAIALNLLFHIPLLWAALLTMGDVLLLLALQARGMRWIEAIIVTLIATIGVCYCIEIFLARPDWIGIGHGLIKPTLPQPVRGENGSLYLALGILGATVMPHNLYLHSSLVQTRNVERTPSALRSALKYNLLETVIALNAAFLVNAAILVMAAAVFSGRAQVVTQIQDAHATLTPLLGSLASTVFAVALLASGQSSTITGTLAGQIVMEGFVSLKIKPWQRRLLTRSLAIVPAILVIAWHSQGGVAQQNRAVSDLLILSQVVLSVQLSFATVPLVLFTSDPKRMGAFANPFWLKLSAWSVVVVIALLNLLLLHNQFAEWLGSALRAKILIALMLIGGTAFGVLAARFTSALRPAEGTA